MCLGLAAGYIKPEERQERKMHFYKFTNKKTGESFFAKTLVDFKTEVLCDILGFSEYTAVEIPEEEYKQEVED